VIGASVAASVRDRNRKDRVVSAAVTTN